ncbi:hypothetical protein B0H14DRAFT_2596143 [Mycena olivaceomarginata]|nr:hypothetical protein B0H14DRAFT_2596143 [Mycena olivaceomarginata]
MFCSEFAKFNNQLTEQSRVNNVTPPKVRGDSHRRQHVTKVGQCEVEAQRNRLGRSRIITSPEPDDDDQMNIDNDGPRESPPANLGIQVTHETPLSMDNDDSNSEDSDDEGNPSKSADSSDGDDGDKELPIAVD